MIISMIELGWLSSIANNASSPIVMVARGQTGSANYLLISQTFRALLYITLRFLYFFGFSDETLIFSVGNIPLEENGGALKAMPKNFRKSSLRTRIRNWISSKTSRRLNVRSNTKSNCARWSIKILIKFVPPAQTHSAPRGAQCIPKLCEISCSRILGSEA